MFPGKFGTFPQQKKHTISGDHDPRPCLGKLLTWLAQCQHGLLYHHQVLGGWWAKTEEQIPSGKLTVAIEHGHRNSGFTHWKRWFSIVMLVYVSLPEGIRKIRIDIWIYVDMDMDHWYLIWIFSKKDTDWYGWIWGMRQPALDLGMFLGNSEFKQMALHQIWNN